MKKATILMLVCAMLLSLGILGGCTEDNNPEGTQEPTGTVAPTDSGSDVEVPEEDDYAWVYEMFGDDVPDAAYTAEMYERIQNGDYRVAIVFENLNQNLLVSIAEGFIAFWEEKGAESLGIHSGDGDMTQVGVLIENCVTMGVDMIGLAAKDLPSVSNICESAIEQGVKFIVRGQASIEAIGFTPAGIELYNTYYLGKFCAGLHLAFLDSYYPDMGEGEYHVATFELSASETISLGMKGFKERLEEDGRGEVVFVKDFVMTIEEGYTAAEEALTYDPSIRGFHCFDESPIIGANNYIAGRTDLNLADFYGEASGVTLAGLSYTDLPHDETIIKALLASGNPYEPENIFCLCSYKCALGLVEEPYSQIGGYSYFGTWDYQVDEEYRYQIPDWLGIGG